MIDGLEFAAFLSGPTVLSAASPSPLPTGEILQHRLMAGEVNTRQLPPPAGARVAVTVSTSGGTVP